MINSYRSSQSLVPYADSLPERLYWTEDSGKIVYRKKINTLIGIDHPGIILGEDAWGYLWIIHHHYKNTYPTVDRIDKFSLGVDVYYDPRKVCYSPYEIVQRAVEQWMERKEYNWLWQNCQHFVNGVACDDHGSEAVDAVGDGALVAAGIFGLAGLLTGNKTFVKLAVGTALAGGAVKALNRARIGPALPPPNNLRRLS